MDTAVDRFSEPTLDAWGILRRHYDLILLCMVVAGILGAIYCLVTPKTYESVAEVLIEENRPPVFNEQTMQDRPSVESGIETHMLVIRSPLVLDAAIEEYRLDRLREFSEPDIDLTKEVDQRLTTDIPDEDAAIIQLRFQSKNPVDCRKSLEAIVATYEDHLDQKTIGLGQEVTGIIQNAKDELLSNLKSKDDAYTQFQKTAPLIWRDGQGVNIFQERQSEIERKRQELIVQHALLDAQIESLADAIQKGGSELQAVYFEALLELHLAEDPDASEEEASRGYSFELAREYMDVLARERELATQYGDEHPDLKAVRARLKEMSRAIENSNGREFDSAGVTLTKKSPISNPEYIVVYDRMLRVRKRALDKQLNILNAQFQIAAKAGEELQGFVADDAALRLDRERTQRLFDAVVSRLEEINIIDDYGGETMELIAAPRDGEQIWPSIPIVGVLSVMLGCIVGSLWAMLREITGRSFHDASDIRATLGVPVIGQVPVEKTRRREKPHPAYAQIDLSLGTIHRPKSRFSESFRGIRTTLAYNSTRNPTRVLQITSPLPSDGKTTVAACLAASIAGAGKRVILIDADMRRPRIHEIYGVSKQAGLSNLINAEIELPDAIQPSGVEGLDLIPSGPIPDNPAELLSSAAFDAIFEKLSVEYDLILVDTPPVLAVSDPGIVASRVDAVLMVIRINKGVRSVAVRAKGVLDNLGANVVGVVVNAAPASHRGYGRTYGYDYQSGHGLDYRESAAYYTQDRTNGRHVRRPANSPATQNGSDRESLSTATSPVKRNDLAAGSSD